MKIAHKIKQGIRLLYDKNFRFTVFHNIGLYDGLSDEKFLKKAYASKFRKKLNLSNPITYSEKLQWLKLYDRNPVYTKMVDKFEAKIIAGNIIGNQYIIPTLGVWDKFDDIDFDKLPNQFVLKCTHDSGGLVICKDKAELDFDYAKKKIENSLKYQYFYFGREWPYKNVKPRIIAEQYMENSETKDLKDYKFFCFDGIPRAIFIATERQNPNEETCFDFFDMDFNHMDLKHGHPNAKIVPQKPKCFDEMKNLAQKLSAGIPQVRIDLYEVQGKVYFGEYTFFHHSGFMPFSPDKWDKIFGDWISLPIEKHLDS